MTDTDTKPHRLAGPDLRSINDPDAVEDIEFLISLGRPNEEIARRCRVGIKAIEKKYGKRNKVA